MSASRENHHLSELRFQLTVTRAMLGTLNLDQVLYIILSGITHGDGLNFNRAFLFLADQDSKEVRASTAVGPSDEEDAHRIWEEMEKHELDLPTLLDAFQAASIDPRTQNLAKKLAGFSMPLSASAPPTPEEGEDVPVQALVARCAASKKAFFSNTLRAVFAPPPASGGKVMHFAKVAAVPLLLADSVIGIILADNIYNKRDIHEEELRGLTTVGNLAAIAIERARLHQRIKDMAALDGLTGVFNRRHYEQRLEQEVARARRIGRSLALLMFDIDYFKRCNDSHGHECGDMVLRDLAAFLKDRVRTEDLVARYGGEEFVVLLTGGATAEESLLVAEKLRAYIESHSLGGRPAGEITVSVGVATQTSDELDGAEIFRRADKALYRAKDQGRNRVVGATGD
jgi:diguanylate cyclase (GGDEF)-like protein